MKRKIRCIYIDGMEKTGKTSVFREMRKYLKDRNKNLHEINGLNQEILKKQVVILNNDDKSFILKQNGLMELYYQHLSQTRSIQDILAEHSEIIRMEQLLGHEYGTVHFFLIPKDSYSADEVFNRNNEEAPNYYHDLRVFFEKINSTSLAQGLNIELIFFDEFDKIFDVRDKIFKILEQKYDF